MGLAVQIASSLARATPVTVNGTTATTAIKKSVTTGATEWLPAGIGINAADADPSEFWLLPSVTVVPGAQIEHPDGAFTVVSVRNQMERATVACKIVKAYRTPQNAPDISTDPQAALYGTPPTRP